VAIGELKAMAGYLKSRASKRKRAQPTDPDYAEFEKETKKLEKRKGGKKEK